MKNLRRSLTVFVSAMLVMAMLVGCGSSVASQLRKATSTSQSSSLDNLVSTIASAGTFSTKTVQSALLECGYEVSHYEISGNKATATVVSEGIGSSSIMESIEIKLIKSTQEALLASADSAEQDIEDTKDSLEASGYTVDDVYLAVAEAGTNQWIVAISYIVTY